MILLLVSIYLVCFIITLFAATYRSTTYWGHNQWDHFSFDISLFAIFWPITVTSYFMGLGVFKLYECQESIKWIKVWDRVTYPIVYPMGRFSQWCLRWKEMQDE